MPNTALAVRVADYVQHVSAEPFTALPREEVERLQGAIETRWMETPEPPTGWSPLFTFTVVHHNYRWLTFERGVRSMGVRAPLSLAEESMSSFLDDAWLDAARRATQQQLPAMGASDWRLAGVLHHGALALVYVARLRQRDLLDQSSAADVFGNGDLRLDVARFDDWSRLLIERLDAF